MRASCKVFSFDVYVHTMHGVETKTLLFYTILHYHAILLGSSVSWGEGEGWTRRDRETTRCWIRMRSNACPTKALAEGTSIKRRGSRGQRHRETIKAAPPLDVSGIRPDLLAPTPTPNVDYRRLSPFFSKTRIRTKQAKFTSQAFLIEWKNMNFERETRKRFVSLRSRKRKKNLIKFNHISGYVFTRVNGVY